MRVFTAQSDSGTVPSIGRVRIFLREKRQSLDAREGLGMGWLMVAFIVALLAIFSREPSLFTYPQFWAEDGSVWYAQAYNSGWLHSLTQPLGGYLNTLQRLGAGAALLVPFRWAPLVMMLEGLFFQALPVPVLLSRRCRNWAPLSVRILFAIVYVGIPDAGEVHVLCTNCHWHLALVELFLAFAAAPRSIVGRVFDVTVFLLGGVCGPFGVLLLPFLAIFWWVRRQRWSLVLLAVLGVGTAFQLTLLRHYEEARHLRYLGASVDRFVKLLGGNVFFGALRGTLPYGYRHRALFCLVPAVIGIALIAYCFRSSKLEVRLFVLYCFAVFAASLRSPLSPPTSLPLWELILSKPGLRYWFFPSLPFLFSIVWCATMARSRVMRFTGIALALLLCVGIRRDWRLSHLVDLHFPQYAAAFEAAPPGAHVVIPLNPPGTEWYMELVKKP